MKLLEAAMPRDSRATVITNKMLKTIFLPFPNVTADTKVLMSGLTVVELLDAGKKRSENVKQIKSQKTWFNLPNTPQLMQVFPWEMGVLSKNKVEVCDPLHKTLTLFSRFPWSTKKLLFWPSLRDSPNTTWHSTNVIPALCSPSQSSLALSMTAIRLLASSFNVSFCLCK